MTASRLSNAGISPYLLYLVFVAAIGPLQFGYHLAELNAPEEALRCHPKSPTPPEPHDDSTALPTCIPMEPAQFAVVSSIYTLGGLVGALAAGPLASRRGRVFPMRLTAPFFVLGSLAEAVAPSIPILALGRVLAGVGAGASMVVGPIYVSEISPPRSKGVLGAVTQVFINLGILIAQLLGYFLAWGAMWRVVLGAASFIGLVQLLALALAVESPEWLGANGRQAAARKTLARIRGGTLGQGEANKWATTEQAEGDEEQSLLQESTGDDPTPVSIGSSEPAKHTRSVGILEVVRYPEHRRAIVAVVAVMLSQQLCGINSVIMYSVSFLSEILPTAAGLITVAVGALNLVMTMLCSPLADRIGRKPCLLLSIAGMGANALLLGVGIIHGVQALTGVATLLFVASFAVGLGPVPFILASELVGPEAVGATQSWALAANWIATFLVAQFFPILNSWLGKGNVFFVFTALAAAFFAFIAWWVPESAGKRDADEVWGRERRERRED